MTKPSLEIAILAAGKGSRMQSSLPKVLHQVAGKGLLAHVIETALQLQPSKIHIVVGHAKDQVIDAFKAHDLGDVEINWVEQVEQLGTGHAVQQVMPGVDDDSNLLMLTADVPLIRSETLAPMVASMTAFPLALLTANFSDPTGLGRIIRDESDGVCGIVEQKDASSAQAAIQEINSGILCARTKDLKTWLSELSNDNAQQEYYLTDIVKIAYAAGNPITAYQPASNVEVEGINSRVQLARVERLYQHNRAEQLMNSGVTIIDPSRIDIRGDVQIGVDSVIDINAVIIGPTIIGSNVSIAPNCTITASEIGDNTHIHANSVIDQTKIGKLVNVGPFARLRPGTQLNDGVRIGNFVETKNAVLDKGAKVNHLSYVGDALVGENTNIGAGVITCNYDGAYKHQTIIGKDVFVGSDSQLVAPIEIEDGATIGAGSTITSNVKKDQLAISRARQRLIDGWKRPKK
ncbi:MAG: bifunctional UDP-N-acetylglucosamine pyrophosphorylase/glucosamine-1-phosphate N-acetyltransferase [Arenicella sp.]|jgi:bifunctional UDP-N-acetylglucosamine pyrophosphorylase/glucosamine-1-phosphate N-acetyltransferase